MVLFAFSALFLRECVLWPFEGSERRLCQVDEDKGRRIINISPTTQRPGSCGGKKNSAKFEFLAHKHRSSATASALLFIDRNFHQHEVQGSAEASPDSPHACAHDEEQTARAFVGCSLADDTTCDRDKRCKPAQARGLERSGPRLDRTRCRCSCSCSDATVAVPPRFDAQPPLAKGLGCVHQPVGPARAGLSHFPPSFWRKEQRPFFNHHATPFLPLLLLHTGRESHLSCRIPACASAATD